MSNADVEKMTKNMGKALGVILIATVSLSFFVTMKSYHAALEKQEQLTELCNNPNARVTSGQEGKELLEKLNGVEKA